MFRSWRVGTAFGIGIYIHPTILFLPLLVLLPYPGSAGVPAAVHNLVLLGCVFVCIVLHELGHALMARAYGIATRDITLYPIGGVASLERMSERPWEEFWIAVAGPAVNVAIAGGLLTLATALGMPVPTPSAAAASPRGNLLAELALVNLGLVVFNLLPAFPMDGGRVLRALLSIPLGRLRATEVAAGLGAGLAVVFFVGGVLSGRFLLILVGAFVYLVGQQELAGVRGRHLSRRPQFLEVLPVDERTLEDNAKPAGAGFSGFTWEESVGAWVLWQNGRPVGKCRLQ
jgi:Zn-dependent protease